MGISKARLRCFRMLGLQSRPSTTRFTAMRPLSMRNSGSQWGWSTNRENQSTSWTPAAASVRGRHLLDHEALTCLLVLLFIDESRLNTSRLHRVLRNLCYHAQTRTWIIGTLLSILQHLTDGMQSEGLPTTLTTLSARMKKSAVPPEVAGASSSPESEFVPGDDLPSWLNIYLCAALGSQASVFHLQRTTKRTTGHSSTSRGAFPAPTGSSNISIHPQASPLVCRHVLDTLISLAKSFPNAFLPNAHSADLDSSASDKAKTAPKTSTLQLSPGASAASASSSSSTLGLTNFWNLLIKLDNAVGGKRGKSLQRLPSGSGSSGVVSEAGSVSDSGFEASPIGQLMIMVAHPVVRRSQLLTDRLLRLLSLVSVGLGDTGSSAPASTSGLFPIC